MLPLQELIDILTADPTQFSKYVFTDILPRLFSDMIICNTSIVSVISSGRIITQFHLNMSKPAIYVDLQQMQTPPPKSWFARLFGGSNKQEQQPTTVTIKQRPTFDLLFITQMFEQLKTLIPFDIFVICRHKMGIKYTYDYKTANIEMHNYLLKTFEGDFGNSATFHTFIRYGYTTLSPLYASYKQYMKTDNCPPTPYTCINLLSDYKDILPHDGYDTINFVFNLHLPTYKAVAVIKALRVLLVKEQSAELLTPSAPILMPSDNIVEGIPVDMDNIDTSNIPVAKAV